MNAIPAVLRKAKRRQSVGSQLFVIIVLSVLAGSHLEKASLRYFVPRQPYEWIGELIAGIGFLIAVIALALRLRREVTSLPQDA